jgi:hypothetical protein
MLDEKIRLNRVVKSETMCNMIDGNYAYGDGKWIVGDSFRLKDKNGMFFLLFCCGCCGC